MFWLSSWDNLHNFSTNIKEDIFLQKFIFSVINHKISGSFFFKNKIKNLNKKYSSLFLNVSENSALRFFFRKNNRPFYTSKIRIVKYCNWLIIYFYMIKPIILKKTQSKKYFEVFSKNFSNIFYKNFLYSVKKKFNFNF